MRQPTKDALRDQLALAADTIMSNNSRIAVLEVAHEYWWIEAALARRRWWHRFAWWRA